MRFDKKTKIVATIGPASDTYEKLLQLVEAGMNVMRVNFSHGDYTSHAHKIALARRLEKEKGIFIPVMLDSRGPEIRVGLFDGDSAFIVQDAIVRVYNENTVLAKKQTGVSFTLAETLS